MFRVRPGVVRPRGRIPACCGCFLTRGFGSGSGAFSPAAGRGRQCRGWETGCLICWRTPRGSRRWCACSRPVSPSLPSLIRSLLHLLPPCPGRACTSSPEPRGVDRLQASLRWRWACMALGRALGLGFPIWQRRAAAALSRRDRDSSFNCASRGGSARLAPPMASQCTACGVGRKEQRPLCASRKPLTQASKPDYVFPNPEPARGLRCWASRRWCAKPAGCRRGAR